VILMSGYAPDEAVRREAEAGRVRFLQKPFNIATLPAEIRGALTEETRRPRTVAHEGGVGALGVDSDCSTN
jgi:FixJ family two-component response regulator